MDNLRSLIKFDSSYTDICREERNLAAIFYHLLLSKDNLRRFLDLIQCPFPIVEDEFGIYFEYAFLRDLWFNIQYDNDLKREVILKLLKAENTEMLNAISIKEFNAYFGVPNPSEKQIQSPSNWSIGKFKGNISNNSEFLRTTELKWAFNAKPDIVIHTSKNSAICIECKLESGEGHYPTSKSEIDEFRLRGLNKVSQTALQKYIMSDLLGIETQFIFLVNNKSTETETHLSFQWRDVFASLEVSENYDFVRKWINRFL